MFEGRVEYVVIPGSDGDFAVFPRHTPLLARLRPSGILRFKGVDEEDAQVLYVFGGFVEVQPTQVTVLADTAIRGAELDAARMRAALALETMLDVNHSDQPINYARAMAELVEYRDHWQDTKAYQHLHANALRDGLN